jgi:sugar-specific transcriptional regulator TrmB
MLHNSIGETKVGKIIEQSRMASSAVHNGLNSLTEKGLVTHILKGKIRSYRAVPPETLLAFHDEKRARLEAAIPVLAAKNPTNPPVEAEVYEGSKGIIAMMNELIADATKNEIFRFFAVEHATKNAEIQRFFARYDVRRQERCRAVRGIARHRDKHLYRERAIAMRYLRSPLPSNMSTCGDKVALITWGARPTAILIHSKELAARHARFFDDAWKRAKGVKTFK